MSILEFIFSSFWTFVGTGMLLVVLLHGIAEIARACRGK